MYEQNILVAACLLGKNCKYNGSHNYHESVCQLSGEYNIIPICPEREGGLEVPREPSEIDSSSNEIKVITKSGHDVTREFLNGAKEAVRKAKKYNVRFCVLKEGSPSCGKKNIYDGTFTHKKLNKMGVTTQSLIAEGFVVYSEQEIDQINDL